MNNEVDLSLSPVRKYRAFFVGMKNECAACFSHVPCDGSHVMDLKETVIKRDTVTQEEACNGVPAEEYSDPDSGNRARRKLDTEDRSLVYLTFCADLSFVQLNEFFANNESGSCTEGAKPHVSPWVSCNTPDGMFRQTIIALVSLCDNNRKHLPQINFLLIFIFHIARHSLGKIKGCFTGKFVTIVNACCSPYGEGRKRFWHSAHPV